MLIKILTYLRSNEKLFQLKLKKNLVGHYGRVHRWTIENDR